VREEIRLALLKSAMRWMPALKIMKESMFAQTFVEPMSRIAALFQRWELGAVTKAC
jgi:hypothetical protein